MEANELARVGSFFIDGIDQGLDICRRMGTQDGKNCRGIGIKGRDDRYCGIMDPSNESGMDGFLKKRQEGRDYRGSGDM